MRVPRWTRNAWRLAALNAVAAWIVLAPLTTGAAMHTIRDMQGRQVAVPDPLTRVALFGGPRTCSVS